MWELQIERYAIPCIKKNVVQILRVTGLKDVPVWYEAGAYHFDFADTNTLFCVQLLLMG
jgi:light-harvesting complex I chlorophyll a/b binding protein 5